MDYFKYNRMTYLVDILNKASEAYYGGKEELMSNYEWDAKHDELVNLEKELDEVLPNSPTHKVSDAEIDNIAGQKEQHEFPALSLAKSKKVDDLVKWADNRAIWMTPKLDGLTLVCTYDNGKLTKLITRGDGHIGTNITFMAKAIKGIPITITEKGHLVVRGEAIISYSDFERINGEEEVGYANPRNLASGTLGLDEKNIDTVKDRNLTLVAFRLVYTEKEINSFGERMDFLDELGFTTVKRELINNPNELNKYIDKWTITVSDKSWDIPVDGLVIVYDDNAYATSGNSTGHHETRGGFAYKWQDEAVETTLDHIEWSCGTTVITPVAVFNPIDIEGTKVSRASLCNLSELERLGIGADGKTKIKVIKANKIIPKVVEVIDKVGGYNIPGRCPCCGAMTTIEVSDSGVKTLKCVNENCPAKNLHKFVKFVGKHGFDIDGLSIETLRDFLELGFIKRFDDIFKLGNYEYEIKRLDGFGEKSFINLMNSIEKSRTVNPYNLLNALSIPLVGIEVSKKIIDKIGFEEFINRVNINFLGNELICNFEDIDGVGVEKSNSICQWFLNGDNYMLFNDLLKYITVEKVEGKGTACSGLTFVITGKLETFVNRDELVAYIYNVGGAVASSVSKKTSYLINNDNTSTSAKNNKAKELGIPIITEKEFLNKFSKRY